MTMLRKLFAKLMGSQKTRKPRKKRAAGAARKILRKVLQKKGSALPKKKRPASPKKSRPSVSAPGKENGRVVAFFRIPVVAVVRVTRGNLKAGDRIWFKGYTTDLKQSVTSMQINHQPIEVARKGDEVGVKVSSRVRRGDRIYRIAT